MATRLAIAPSLRAGLIVVGNGIEAPHRFPVRQAESADPSSHREFADAYSRNDQILVDQRRHGDELVALRRCDVTLPNQLSCPGVKCDEMAIGGCADNLSVLQRAAAALERVGHGAGTVLRRSSIDLPLVAPA